MMHQLFGKSFSQGQQVLEALPGSEVGSVWISGYKFAEDQKQLRQKNIFAIVDAAGFFEQYPSEFTSITFDLQDVEHQQIRHCFDEAYNFIQQQRNKTNVLVHCAAGVSRSASILISYIIRKMGVGYDEAFKIVFSKRSCIQPNEGFEQQLRVYERQLKSARKNNTQT